MELPDVLVKMQVHTDVHFVNDTFLGFVVFLAFAALLDVGRFSINNYVKCSAKALRAEVP